MVAPFTRQIVAATLLALAAPSLMGSISVRHDLNERLLAAQNRERAVMMQAPLVWDEGLAANAGEWARYLAKTGKFEHSPDKPEAPLEGENLWAGTADAYPPESMIGLWLAEKRDFKPGTFPSNSRSNDVTRVSHYTQLVWARTNAVGCALAKGRDEDFLVCRYSRPGNIIGEQPI
ncbi:MAG: SCP-like extracellular [Tardiphaga sp.]|uniref:CAP domain-containing protein n=1 Tax=Tardiphaga sp. TaxID=1926292 RepID=UPI001998752A|nr:CAP domain-containing protein [Tardiphaga sp.]MBC7586289.1 SCP-like extracellular [Tardiphaga sp.]